LQTDLSCAGSRLIAAPAGVVLLFLGIARLR
jgi:hypothetical protein